MDVASSRCLVCGKPIRPPARLCRVHAAAEARRVMSLLRASGEVAIDDAQAIPTTAADVNSERGVIELGVRLAFKIAVTSEPTMRASYYKLLRDTLVPIFEMDSRRIAIGATIAVSQHPFVAEVIGNRQPRLGSDVAQHPGPRARELAERTGVLAAAIVPVLHGESVHGIITLGSRTPSVSMDLFDSLVYVGRLLELALAGLSADGRQRRRRTRAGTRRSSP